MAVPKGKVSRQRRDKRRSSHWKLTAPAVVKCPNCGAFVMLMGLVIVPVVSAFTKKQDARTLDEFFSCYEHKVLVSAKDALGDEAE